MTRIYEENKESFVRPDENQFVRIKSGLYQDDLGIVYRIRNDNQIYVKLVPRVDPIPKSSAKADAKR
jgi:hypothetical protein